MQFYEKQLYLRIITGTVLFVSSGMKLRQKSSFTILAKCMVRKVTDRKYKIRSQSTPPDTITLPPLPSPLPPPPPPSPLPLLPP
jgi:hypothetical protein